MRTQILRWLIPVMVVLVMATAFIFGQAVLSHAAGTTSTTKPAITTPTVPSASPNFIFYH